MAERVSKSIIHSWNPNGSNTRLCGELRSLDDCDPTYFLGLLIYGDNSLCPGCVDGIEFRVMTWREETGKSYRGP